MRIDLHTHSDASDGTDTPAELVANAVAAGLDVVAITDHDTTAGWDEATAALDRAPAGFRLVRGMEMSCEGRGEDGDPVPVHLLAYLFDPADATFAAERIRQREERIGRLRSMAVKIAADYPIDPDAVLARVGTSAGRPHLAAALVAAGVVDSVGQAFEDLLSRKSKYYVPKLDAPLDDAVAMIAAAGGVSVIAHARARMRGRLLALDHIEELAELGLGGLEIFHPDHNDDDRALLAHLAASLDLIGTGSSDYHGDNKALRLGECSTDPEAFEALAARATGVSVLVAGATRSDGER
ncbi:PHP domain-containing protein [Aldersonia sp. NBC_00410]|uniref:PHP domain-containing protein n=1 Tax=Aldersonia sp. NBC_00410 TaxID=2975954 RepID=UPI00224CCC19|nr:PHP domain-containing protein [Aldersonia sp. NBC_00410]MCX5043729.1 PHP domain-containing protein [Aldersonia sp. NBC_00410]